MKLDTTKFVHLHLHSDFSLLDGVGTSIEYAALAAENKQTAIALTDHGNMYGLPQHWRACAAAGIKPIAGCEVYVSDARGDDRGKVLKGKAKAQALEKGTIDPTHTDSHLLLIAQTQQGWRNLLKINHDAVREGYYYQPRTCNDYVLTHAEGLVCTTACVGSQFGMLARLGRIRELRALMTKYKDAFQDRFFVELQVHEFEAQKLVNTVLMREAKSLGIKMVITADVHYACMSDSPRQNEVIAISRRTQLDDPKAFKIESRTLWYSTPDQMWLLAKRLGYEMSSKDFAQAVYNTYEIAQSCNVKIYEDGTAKPPKYIDSAGKSPPDSHAALERVARAGLAKRFARCNSDYRARLDHELQIIKRCGMADFYLVAADIVRECRSRGIYSWTRGSGCASLVACAIGITSVDPIRFGLLFERFVDPDRAAAPDFDIDMDSERRGEIIQWLITKYGGDDGERIARISAVSTFGVKSAFRDLCMARGVPKELVFRAASSLDTMDLGDLEERLAASVPASRCALLSEAQAKLSESPAVAQVSNQYPGLLPAAMTLVGRAHHRTQHAAGYLLAPGPIVDYVPIDKAGGEIVTAWGEGLRTQDLAPTGLLKVDLLGLNTLTVVSQVVKDASDRTGRDVFSEINGLTMNYEDESTARDYWRGNGFGIHQLNEQSQMLASLVKRMKPTCVEQIIAAIALYRPGSIDQVERFVKRAKGAVYESVEPTYDAILKETYGIIVYQEQIMRIMHELGGVPLRKAYETIKAISKQKKDKVEAARGEFIEGASKRLPRATAGRIFELIEKFAGYGFNKAHSASYGVLSWITAYLRSRYPYEFFCAWLNGTPNESGKGHERRIESLMRTAQQFGIRLLPPDVTTSGDRWSYHDYNDAEGERQTALVAPLSLTIGVGDAAARHIKSDWATRYVPGKTTLPDFIAWADANRRIVNSKTVRALACVGAFRRLAKTEHAYDFAEAYYASKSKAKGRLQALVGQCDENPDSVYVTPRSAINRGKLERQALGFAYWNDAWRVNHRGEKADELLAQNRIAPCNDTRSRGKRRAFLLSGVSVRKDRRGCEMAFLNLTGRNGAQVRGLVFSSEWSKLKPHLRVESVYLMAGEFDNGTYMVRANGTRNIDEQ